MLCQSQEIKWITNSLTLSLVGYFEDFKAIIDICITWIKVIIFFMDPKLLWLYVVWRWEWGYNSSK